MRDRQSENHLEFFASAQKRSSSRERYSPTLYNRPPRRLAEPPSVVGTKEYRILYVMCFVDYRLLDEIASRAIGSTLGLMDGDTTRAYGKGFV